MKIEIKSRFTGEVLFTHDFDENSIKITVEAAIRARANLNGANLDGASLYGANLYGANLTRASFYGANLNGASLYGASLNGANLYGANLTRASFYGANLNGANLTGANLDGANLNGANLTRASFYGANLNGEKIIDIKQIGNIGSRQGYTVCFRMEKSIKINCGCFWGDIQEFVDKVKSTHGKNKHAAEYLAMISFIKKIWKAK